MANVESNTSQAQLTQVPDDQDLLALTVEPIDVRESEPVEGAEPVASIMTVIALTWAT